MLGKTLVPPIFRVARFDTVRAPPELARLAVKVTRSNVPLDTVRLPVTLAFMPKLTVLALLASVRLLKVVAKEPPMDCVVLPLKVRFPLPAVKAEVETLFAQLPATLILKLLAFNVPALRVRLLPTMMEAGKSRPLLLFSVKL